MTRGLYISLILFLCLLVSSFGTMPASAKQKLLSKAERERNKAILNDAYHAIKQYYYDPKFHGLDLKELHAEYEKKVEESESNGQAFRMIAAFMGKLNDSHTRFIPPGRPYSFDPGYRIEMIGDRCFVTAVRPGSDAARKIQPGDQVLRLQGYTVDRADIADLLYYMTSLAPQPVSVFDLLNPAGQRRTVRVTAEYKSGEKVVGLSGIDLLHYNLQQQVREQVLRDREVEMGDAVIWKMPIFQSDDSHIKKFFKIASKHRTLILDLRGNAGGSEKTLESILGYLFDHRVRIADRISRDGKNPLVAKSHGKHAFSGQLIVLVDSESASAAELLARVVQL